MGRGAGWSLVERGRARYVDIRLSWGGGGTSPITSRGDFASDKRKASALPHPRDGREEVILEGDEGAEVVPHQRPEVPRACLPGGGGRGGLGGGGGCVGTV